MMSFHPVSARPPVFFLLAGLLTAARLAGAEGPTPYPDAKVESAWPGRGAIRTAGWMADNRKWFWTQRAKDQGAVVLTGDSLTGGWGADALARAFPGLKVATRGIGGDVSRGLLFRLREDVLDLKPRALVLCIGTNDLSTHDDPANAKANIREMLALAREHNPALPIVLCLVPPRDVADAPVRPAALADLNDRIRKVGAGREHLVVLDLFTPLAMPEGRPAAEFFAKDRIHLGPAGYEKWAELLRPALAGLGVR